MWLQWILRGVLYSSPFIGRLLVKWALNGLGGGRTHDLISYDVTLGWAEYRPAVHKPFSSLIRTPHTLSPVKKMSFRKLALWADIKKMIFIYILYSILKFYSS
jgi:hypothetical protein